MLNERLQMSDQSTVMAGREIAKYSCGRPHMGLSASSL